MPSYQEIYEHHADRYDELVDREDCENHLGQWLDGALSSPPSLVVELGCGTGRLTRMLAKHATILRAYDGYPHMIERAQQVAALQNVTYKVSDNASLPEAKHVADAIFAGWTIGHLTGLFPNDWKSRVEAVLDGMDRIAKNDARVVIIETLGTCVDAPSPPNERLGAMYELLESQRGFRCDTISTDYEFESATAAARIMGFFFGEGMAERVRMRDTSRVPEWTGIWWRAHRT